MVRTERPLRGPRTARCTDAVLVQDGPLQQMLYSLSQAAGTRALVPPGRGALSLKLSSWIDPPRRRGCTIQSASWKRPLGELYGTVSRSMPRCSARATPPPRWPGCRARRALGMATARRLRARSCAGPAGPARFSSVAPLPRAVPSEHRAIEGAAERTRGDVGGTSDGSIAADFARPSDPLVGNRGPEKSLDSGPWSRVHLSSGGERDRPGGVLPDWQQDAPGALFSLGILQASADCVRSASHRYSRLSFAFVSATVRLSSPTAYAPRE